MNRICYIVMVLVLVGCSTTRDVSSTPDKRTDFIIGQAYEIRKPVFLYKINKNDPRETPRLAELGFGGTSKNLEEFRRRAPNAPQVAGLLNPGDRIRVTKFIEDRSVTLGTFFKVYAVILSGEYKGTVVGLNLISKEANHLNGAFINPVYLAPVPES